MEQGVKKINPQKFRENHTISCKWLTINSISLGGKSFQKIHPKMSPFLMDRSKLSWEISLVITRRTRKTRWESTKVPPKKAWDSSNFSSFKAGLFKSDVWGHISVYLIIHNLLKKSFVDTKPYWNGSLKTHMPWSKRPFWGCCSSPFFGFFLNPQMKIVRH